MSAWHEAIVARVKSSARWWTDYRAYLADSTRGIAPAASFGFIVGDSPPHLSNIMAHNSSWSAAIAAIPRASIPTPSYALDSLPSPTAPASSSGGDSCGWGWGSCSTRRPTMTAPATPALDTAPAPATPALTEAPPVSTADADRRRLLMLAIGALLVIAIIYVATREKKGDKE